MNKDPQLISRIEETLAQLRPYLEADNGNISFVEVTEDMIVRVRLEGACSSCSMSMMTLKAGVEQSLLKATGQPIFTQLLKLIPREMVSRLSSHYQTNRYVKALAPMNIWCPCCSVFFNDVRQ
ncbi:MAG: NifU family protein [Bacteroidetes bacterium]|nr:NifU family protein [Bacteroidota bacterium]